jgi:hypothetical protein
MRINIKKFFQVFTLRSGDNFIPMFSDMLICRICNFTVLMLSQGVRCHVTNSFLGVCCYKLLRAVSKVFDSFVQIFEVQIKS